MNKYLFQYDAIIIRNIFFVPISNILWTCVTWDLCSAFLLKDDASFDDGMPRLTSNTTRMTVYTVETQVVQSSQRMKREGGKKRERKRKGCSSIRFENIIPPKEPRTIYESLSRKENDPSNGYCIDYTSVHSFKSLCTVLIFKAEKKISMRLCMAKGVQ